MSTLLTSDIHLTDNPEDSYRFDFLDHIKKQVKDSIIDEIIIAGDLTDKKNYHSSKLVNGVVSSVSELSKLCDVYILKGNHDYYAKEHPFFEFFNFVTEGVIYISDPKEYQLSIGKCLFLPHTDTPESDWKDIKITNEDHIFMHQTVNGSKASNGAEMEGMSGKFVKDKFKGKQIWSGDIHVPQTISGVTYCGSPFPIHFGDKFKPRYIEIGEKGEYKEYYFNSPQKIATSISEISDLEVYDLQPGDFLKVEVKLPKEEWTNWKEHKNEIKDYLEEHEIINKGITVAKLSPDKTTKKSKKQKEEQAGFTREQFFDKYCETNKVDKFTLNKGKEFL